MWTLGIALLTIIAIFFIALFTTAYIHGHGSISIGFVAMEAPEFWEHYPKEDDDKEYYAQAGIQTEMFVGFPRKQEKVTGIQAAYVEARRLGVEVEWKEKLRNPRMSAYEDGSYPNSVGVWWNVVPVEEYDNA